MKEKLIDRILEEMEKDKQIQFLPTREQARGIKWFVFHGACLDCEFQKNYGVEFCGKCSVGMKDDNLTKFYLYDYKKTAENIEQNIDIKKFLL